MEKVEVMPLDKAMEEVVAWLDYKRISQSDRDKYKDSIDKLAEHVSNGELTIDGERVITHNLIFPVTVANKLIDKITYKPFLTVKEVKEKTQKVKAGDSDGRLQAYVEACSGMQEQVLDKLNTVDSNIANSVAVFFMV